MKSTPLVFSGLVLAAATITLQIGWMLPQSEPLASAARPRNSIRLSIKRRPTLTAQVAPVAKKNPTTTHASALLPIVDRPEFREDHKRIADALLRQLPPSCVEKLTTFIIRYDNPEQRGLAGKSTVILSGNVSREEFVGLFLHEVFGHFYELGCLQGNERSGRSAYVDGKDVMWNDDPSVFFYQICFQTSVTANGRCGKHDYVTGYASSDAFEFLAEAMAYYYLQPDDFRERAKVSQPLAQQLAWMDRYAPTHTQIALGTEKTIAPDVPWDATRTAFSLSRTFTAMIGE